MACHGWDREQWRLQSFTYHNRNKTVSVEVDILLSQNTVAIGSRQSKAREVS